MKNQILKFRKMLKFMNKFLIKILPLNLHSYLYIKILKYFNKVKIERIQNRTQIPLLDIEGLKKYKKTDKIFILGSGSSINDLTEEDWREISKYDTIGFNFWLYHNIVPKFYCYEENLDKSRNKIFYQLLNLRQKDYENVIFIVKDLEYKGITDKLIPNGLKKNFVLSYELTVPYDKESQILEFLRKCKEEKILIKKNGTLSYLINLSSYLGYKEIVLCGIDLDNNDYFYFNKKYIKYPQLNKTTNCEKEHLTELGIVKMSDIVMILEKEMKDVTIKIYLKTGKLKEKIKIYKN